MIEENVVAMANKPKEATMTANKLRKSADVEKSMTPERKTITLGVIADADK